MSGHFLTKKYFISGLIFGLVEKIIDSKNKKNNSKFSGYELQKNFRIQGSESPNTVGLYKKKNRKFIIKSINYSLKNLSYEQLQNEGSIAYVLSKYNKSKNVNFANILEFIYKRNNFAVVSEFIKGEKLAGLSRNLKIKAIKNILTALEEITLNLPDEEKKNLPKRDVFLLPLSLPFYLLTVILRDYKNTGIYLNTFAEFMKNCLSLIGANYKLAHRDIHSDNIIFSKNKFYLLDTEITALATEQTDIAIAARLYSKELGSELIKLLNTVLDTEHKKRRFLALSAFYALQIMAMRTKDDPDFVESFDYVKDILPSLPRKLIETKITPAEAVYLTGLNIIYKINKMFSVELKTKVILCYHSVSNEGWRFSTKISDFEDQIRFLVANRQVLPLKKILNTKSKNAVAVTFDDGYLDNLKNAQPILKKYKIKPTLFVLGDRLSANRNELDNDKQLLTIAQIKKLKKQGWEIGYHTKTHSDLRILTDQQLFEEIISSKIVLEKKLGFKLKYFAYPRGTYSDKIKAYVKKAGFKAAFTVDGGTALVRDKFLINRMSIEGSLNFEAFKAMITGSGIFFTVLMMKLLKTKEQMGFKFENFKEILNRKQVKYSYKQL